MKYKNYVVLDFETGGLDPRKNATTEFAGLILDGFSLESKETYTSLIKPYSNELTYDSAALNGTGITMEMLETGDDIKNVVNEIKDLFLKATTTKGEKYKPVIVGHNVQFDIGFLSQLFLFCKEDLSKYIGGRLDIYGTFYPSFIDTVEMTALGYGNDEDLKNWKLGNVCSHVGIELNDAHRAMNDVYATSELLKFYIKRLRNSNLETNSSNDISRFRTNFQIKMD